MQTKNKIVAFVAGVILPIVSHSIDGNQESAAADEVVLHDSIYPDPIVDTSTIGSYKLGSGKIVKVVPIGYNISNHVLGADISFIQPVGGTPNIVVAPTGITGAARTLEDPIHINDLNNKIAGRGGLNIVFRGGEHVYKSDATDWEIRIDGNNNSFDSYRNEKVIISGANRIPTATTSVGWGSGGLRIKGSGNMWQRMHIAQMPFIGIRVEGNYNVFQGMQVYKNFGGGVAFYDDKTPNTHQGQGGSYNIIRHSYIYLNSGAGVIDHPDYPGRYSDGGNSDGTSASKGTVGNTWENLTIWKSSDDGLDFWISKDSVARKVISAFNGLGNGDGNGFKFGGSRSSLAGDTGKVISSISFQDRAEAFSNNGGINSEVRNVTAVSGGSLNVWIGPSSSVIDSISANGADYLEGTAINFAQDVSLNNFISLDPLSPNLARPKVNSGLQNQGAYAFACETPYSLPNNQWRQISLPCDPGTNNKVEDVFGDSITGTYGTDWILYHYDTDDDGYVPLKATNPLSQGVGYWIIQINEGQNAKTLYMSQGSLPTPINVQASATTCTSSKGCFELSLATQATSNQWSMIGYPFAATESLGNVRVQTDGGTCASGCDLDTAQIESIFHGEFLTYNGTKYTLGLLY